MSTKDRVGARLHTLGGAVLLAALLACALVRPAAADNPAPAECTAGQIKVTPGAWFPAGIRLNQGDQYSVTATGYMWWTTGSDGKPNSGRNGGWGPGGHADPLGFGAANGLKGGIVGTDDSTDLGSNGSGAAKHAGQLQLGEARAYLPNPNEKKTISGWFCVTVTLPSAPPPAAEPASSTMDPGCSAGAPPELANTPAPAPATVVQPMPIDLPPDDPGAGLSLQAAAIPAEAPNLQGAPIGPVQRCPRLITFAVLGADEDQPFVKYANADKWITAPASLDQVIGALQDATRDGAYIGRLYFLAHAGVSQPVSPANTFMELGGRDYTVADFAALRSKAPDITRVFARDAVVSLLNCDLGSDPAFVATIADLFLRRNGGYIDAKTGSVASWSNSILGTETRESPSRLFGDGDWVGWRQEPEAMVNMGFAQALTRWPPPPPPPPDSTISPAP